MKQSSRIGLKVGAQEKELKYDKSSEVLVETKEVGPGLPRGRKLDGRLGGGCIWPGRSQDSSL